MDTIQLLRDYFPTAVYTGQCLVFISEDWRVELSEHKESDFTKKESGPSIIRVKVFKKTINGEVLPSHHEDFRIASLGMLAEEVEKYIQMAIGSNLHKNIE
jgi:hypothetical protein